MKSLLRSVTDEQKSVLIKAGRRALFLTSDAGRMPEIKSKTVQLTVTSPPFLDIVTYSKDNWLRCWFNSLNDETISSGITTAKSVLERNFDQSAGIYQDLKFVGNQQ